MPGAGQHTDNLACKACNFIKSDENFTAVGQSLTRDQLIAKAAEFIYKRRNFYKERLLKVRELLALLDKPSAP